MMLSLSLRRILRSHVCWHAADPNMPMWQIPGGLMQWPKAAETENFGTFAISKLS
ncbi:MAG: hypothetical protein ACJASV_000563 [Pseudorhodobacter sp.]|jgi:hypothetical protein